MMLRSLCIAGVLATATAHALPPGPRDPDWPCQQIKVPELSLAAVWSGPPIDRQLTEWQQDSEVAELAQQLAQRRVPLEQAQDRIRAFAQQAKEQKQTKLLELLAGLFSIADEQRSSVMAGLDRFGVRQKQLAAGIRDDNEKLHAMQADPSTKAADLNQMVQRVTWEAEIFQDRRQALTYVCDVPGKIEQRLFALARTVQQELE